jgi:nucleolar MIF4G domain-containing protein 1
LEPEKKAELERAIRGCVNRVAEGNIDSILNKMVEIYNQNSKYVINELYSEIFMKSCIEQPHVLQMILAANACLIAALYHYLGDDFIADFIRKITICLRENIEQKPQSGNAEESGPGNFKLKNAVLVFCYLYDFDALHEEFLGDLVVYLAEHLNEETIVNIMAVIHNAGFKIRQTSPGSIKVSLLLVDA